MKKQLTIVLTLTLLAMIQVTSVAQINWGSFSTMLQQLNATQRSEYFDNLDRVYDDFDPRRLDLGLPVDRLNEHIRNGNPGAGLSGFTNEWSGARDELNRTLQGSNLNNDDKSSITNEFEKLRMLWQNNHNDIRGAYNVLPNNTHITNQLPTRIYRRDYRVWSNSQDILLHNLVVNAERVPARGLGDFRSLFNQLFNRRLFTDIAFFGGIQTAKVRYFSTHFSKNLPVVGINTVEQFNTTWEARWSGQVSFETSNTTQNLNTETQTNGIVSTRYKPLFLNGDFAIMFNPTIRSLSRNGLTVRLISSLGVDIGTYAPAHVTAQNPNNKGYATGWGPQVGAGFALKAGAFTSYTMGTLAYGEVICPGMRNDRYRSSGLEAGIRYLDRVTVKYKLNNWDWTERTISRIKNGISQQITMGLPIDGLFHRP